MAPLSKDTIPRYRASAASRHRVGELAADAVIYNGALIAKNAAGNIVPASDAAGLKVVGVAEGFADNTDGDAGDVSVPYVTGIDVELDNAGGAVGLTTRLAYVSDDHSVTTAAVAANDILAGYVAEFSATKVWCYVDETNDLADTETPLDGADVSTVADNNVLGGVPVEHIMAVPDAVTGDVTIVFTEKTEITRINGFKTAGAGAAGNTYQFKNGATAITDAIDGNVADKVVLNPATVDDAQNVIAAGGSLVCTRTKAGGNAAARFFIHGVKRA